MKKKLISGITATGTLTLGNYLGAIKNFVNLQKKYKMFIFVADLHALTTTINPQVLRKNKRDIMALYIACGLNPKQTILFNQSDILEHGQINWIITTQTTIGELKRMNQFKNKLYKIKNNDGTNMIPTGLLMYPLLMTGDILLYNANIVVVGSDQKQHLELTRSIAKRFNNKYGQIFNIPKPHIAKEGSKIMSLTNPNVKMSKSATQTKSYISLLDNPSTAADKIKLAITDSENKIYISDKKPGILNLLTIYAGLKNITIKKAEAYFKNYNYKDFKQDVAITVYNFLNDLQKKYNKTIKKVKKISKKGAKKASKIASKNIIKIENRIGLK